MQERFVRGVIFGLGNYWKSVKPFLKDKLKIVAYMDNYIKMMGGGVYLPGQWHELDFDKILICVVDYKKKLEMMNQLLGLGIEKERIGFIEEYLKNYNIKVVPEGEGSVTIETNGVIVRCENEIEYMIAQEIFAEEEYGFHINAKYFVIDVGMNIGCATLYFAGQENVTSVYGFEPFKGVYDKAVSNISMNSKAIQEKVHVCNTGLGARDGIEKYIAHEGIYESAGIKKVQDGVEHSDNIIEIKIRQASRILEDIISKHEEKCLLKIDCEGAEYGIFEDLIENGCMDKIDMIIMEWHIGKYGKLEDLLRKAGFTYVLNKNSRDFGMCYAWRERR